MGRDYPIPSGLDGLRERYELRAARSAAELRRLGGYCGREFIT